MIKQLDQFHKTKRGYLVFGLVELALAYGFLCLSIDRGNPLWYLLTLVFVYGVGQNLFKLVKDGANGR